MIGLYCVSRKIVRVADDLLVQSELERNSKISKIGCSALPIKKHHTAFCPDCMDMRRVCSVNVSLLYKVRKTDMLVLFCLILVHSLPRHSFSPLHSASGNAFKSSNPGKRAAFVLVEHTVCFGQLPNLLSSFVCHTLWSVFLPLCSL